MNTNPETLRERRFKMPMDWASDKQLQMMQEELVAELRLVHVSVAELAKARNGLKAVEREINWRCRTGGE